MTVCITESDNIYCVLSGLYCIAEETLVGAFFDI